MAGQPGTQQTQQAGFAQSGQQYSQPPPSPQQMGSGQQQFAPPSQQQGQLGQQQMFGRNLTLEEGISDEMRVALHDFVQAANACEWCADQCLDEGPQMAECIRLCRDVADLAELNIQLLTRDSVFGPEAAEVFALAADACAQECAQHPMKHCQECAEVLPRAARSTRKMLASFGAQGTQGMQAQSMQGAQQATGQF